MQPNQREINLIFGQTGSGKTTMASEILSRCPRAIVVEAGYGEFPALQFGRFEDLVAHLEKIGAFKSRWVPFRVSWSPKPAEYDLPFDLALELGSVMLILDEADRFDAEELPNYWECIARGRHELVSISCAALAPFDMPKDQRRQITRLVSFRQVEPSDVDWIRDVIRSDVALELPNLPGPPDDAPPFPYLEWRPGKPAEIVWRGAHHPRTKDNT